MISALIHEFEIHYVRSSGPGGQNVNKVNSKCVISWDVAGSLGLAEPVRARFLARFASRLTKDGRIVLSGDSFRNQKQNLEDCLARLGEMIRLVARPPKPRHKTKPSFGSVRRRVNDKLSQGKKKALRQRKPDED